MRFFSGALKYILVTPIRDHTQIRDRKKCISLTPSTLYTSPTEEDNFDVSYMTILADQ